MNLADLKFQRGVSNGIRGLELVAARLICFAHVAAIATVHPFAAVKLSIGSELEQNALVNVLGTAGNAAQRERRDRFVLCEQR